MCLHVGVCIIECDCVHVVSIDRFATVYRQFATGLHIYTCYVSCLFVFVYVYMWVFVHIVLCTCMCACLYLCALISMFRHVPNLCVACTEGKKKWVAEVGKAARLADTSSSQFWGGLGLMGESGKDEGSGVRPGHRRK